MSRSRLFFYRCPCEVPSTQNNRTRGRNAYKYDWCGVLLLFFFMRHSVVVPVARRLEPRYGAVLLLFSHRNSVCRDPADNVSLICCFRPVRARPSVKTWARECVCAVWDCVSLKTLSLLCCCVVFVPCSSCAQKCFSEPTQAVQHSCRMSELSTITL